jgi:hypothetical protein
LGNVVQKLDNSDAVDLQELQEYTSEGRTKGGFEFISITDTEFSSAAGQYQDQYGFIELNSRTWEDSDDLQEFLVNDGDIVENVAIHEFGHALHGKSLDEDQMSFSDVRDNEIPTETLENEISTYAAQNATESVAEMFVYQARGNELSGELQNLYDELGGPEVPDL